MTRPVYECPICGTRQPGPESHADSSPPETLGNTTCKGKYGGCLRMTRLELVPEATWEPGRWELACAACEYETVAWGAVGFADTSRWSCPDCGRSMLVTSVRQTDEIED